MGWNNWGYWVRGGAIGLAIYLVCILSYAFFEFFISNETLYMGLGTIILSISLSPIIIIGLFLGWLYGKIKGRK